jgi:hypothetical protein
MVDRKVWLHAVGLILALTLAGQTPALGRYKAKRGEPIEENFPLPAALANAVVRAGSGSGVVYKIKKDRPDDPATPGWLCVLSADHVGATAIGFGNGDPPNGSRPNEFLVQVTIPGPKTGKNEKGQDTFADIKMLGVRFTDLSKLPRLADLSLTEFQRGVEGVQAGYGSAAVVDTIQRAYYPDQSYGTYRTWNNEKLSLKEGYSRRSGKHYSFTALEGQLYFLPEGAFGNRITFGSSYTLPGDSGGPTFQKVDNDWKLVGIHSSALLMPDEAKNDHAPNGSTWSDVYAWEYRQWIMDSCNAVPEPATILAFGGGIAAWILRRRRRRG